MNKDLMFSSDKDDWETPQLLFDDLDKKYHFTKAMLLINYCPMCGRKLAHDEA